MLDRLRTWFASDSAKRVVRTFVIAFAGVALPGMFGFLHGLTEWARAQGQTPFPDARSLAFLGVAAIVAGSVALLNLAVVWVEDATGKGVLRETGPGRVRDEGGYFNLTSSTHPAWTGSENGNSVRGASRIHAHRSSQRDTPVE